MKIVYFLLASLVFGCKTKLENNVSVSNVIETEGVNDEIHYRKFLIGDVNNDKIQDTSSVIFKTENEYKDVVIQFSGGIPFINFGPSLGIFIKGTDDVNNDNANEILVFSRTHEGWWNNISVWSFQNGKWNQIQKAKAFISDDKDFENRMVKENNHYYLIGDDQWNEDEIGNFKKIRLKI